MILMIMILVWTNFGDMVDSVLENVILMTNLAPAESMVMMAQRFFFNGWSRVENWGGGQMYVYGWRAWLKRSWKTRTRRRRRRTTTTMFTGGELGLKGVGSSQTRISISFLLLQPSFWHQRWSQSDTQWYHGPSHKADKLDSGRFAALSPKDWHLIQDLDRLVWHHIQWNAPADQ